jgi:hypothetical protein
VDGANSQSDQKQGKPRHVSEYRPGVGRIEAAVFRRRK